MSRTTRRAFLAGVVGAGAVGALVACGDESSAGDQGSDGGGSGGTGSTDGGSGGHGQPGGLAKVSDIPVGGGKVFERQQVVVTQPTPGDFRAFTAICTHQSCTVASVANGVITCPCHGSQYSALDGSVRSGPALRGLAAKKIEVVGDNIILA